MMLSSIISMNKGSDLAPCCDPHIPLVVAFGYETNNKEKFCLKFFFVFVLHGMQYLYIFCILKITFILLFFACSKLAK